MQWEVEVAQPMGGQPSRPASGRTHANVDPPPSPPASSTRLGTIGSDSKVQSPRVLVILVGHRDAEDGVRGSLRPGGRVKSAG